MYWSKFKFFLIQMNSNSREVLAGGWGGGRGRKKNFDQLEKKTVNSPRNTYIYLFCANVASVSLLLMSGVGWTAHSQQQLLTDV